MVGPPASSPRHPCPRCRASSSCSTPSPTQQAHAVHCRKVEARPNRGAAHRKGEIDGGGGLTDLEKKHRFEGPRCGDDEKVLQRRGWGCRRSSWRRGSGKDGAKQRGLACGKQGSPGLSILLIDVMIEPMPNENTLMISNVIMEKPRCGILFRRRHSSPWSPRTLAAAPGNAPCSLTRARRTPPPPPS
jgi:hypothetical protein